MNIRSTAAAFGAALTLAVQPVLAAEVDTGPAEFAHNVAQDAQECVITAEAISYDYAITTDACKRFGANGARALEQMNDGYYDRLKEHKPELLFEVYEDVNVIHDAAGRMMYLGKQ